MNGQSLAAALPTHPLIGLPFDGDRPDLHPKDCSQGFAHGRGHWSDLRGFADHGDIHIPHPVSPGLDQRDGPLQ